MENTVKVDLSTVSREGLIDILVKYVATINFTKKDGTERQMICTRNAKYMTGNAITPKELDAARKKENDQVISVWDIEKEAWRSFRIDSLKDFRYTKEE